MRRKVRVERTHPSCAGRRPQAMKVVLTGATGFVGSHVLADLYQHGHEVTALVRDDAQADTVAARGATPVVVDLYDRPAVARLLGHADGAIHTASPGDATSADLDSAVVDAVTGAFAGTGHPRGVTLQRARDGVVEGADRTPGARRDGHPRRRDRLQRRLRRRRGRDSRAASRLAPGRRRPPGHARHGPAALVDGARRRPGGCLPARAGK